VEGPSLRDKPLIVERRSLHSALRAPVGTTNRPNSSLLTEAIFVALERSAEPRGKFDVAAAQTDIAEDAVVERHQLLDGAA